MRAVLQPLARHRTFITALLVALAAFAFYMPDLAGSPFYLNRDEMFFGLTAHSLATTGFDANGHYLPLYTQSPMRYGSEMWFQPALMYSAALAVKLFGLTEGTVRLPMTSFAIADIVLMYLIGRELFKREALALGSAALLALSPAHYIHARVAMDFQAPLPFLLAWLLFLMKYLNGGGLAWLVAAGASLGIGVFTYIAAYMWMPTYAALTLIVLWIRRETIKRGAMFAAACVVPVLSCVPFLITHPTVIRDVMWHYDREQPQAAGGAELFVNYFGVERFAKAASVYWNFFSARFLFIDGPGGLWAGGVFLLVMAGVLLCGVPAVLRKARVESVLLLGGLLTAAIPASLVGDMDAIHRASAVLPFAVLVALYTFTAFDRPGVATVLFLVMWAVPIWLASNYHAELPLAQAAIRACTVPIAVAALYALLAWRPRLGGGAPFWIAAATVVVLLEPAYYVLGFDRVAWVLVLAAAGLAAVVYRDPRRNQDAFAAPVAGALLGIAASLFLFAHGDYSPFARIGPIPATAIVMSVRIILTLAAVAGFVGVSRVATTGFTPTGAVAIAAVVLSVLGLQLAYYHIDYFVAASPRSLQALAVFALAAIAGAMTLRVGSWPRMLSLVGGAALAGAGLLQFSGFYGDYFTRYRAEAGQFDTEGNSRIAWESVIARAERQEVPAIYFGGVGPYGFADLYWQFYAIKHQREDLLPRTTADKDFDTERVMGLPAGSLVVTSPSPEIDAAIERMSAARLLRSAELLTAPQPRSKFWLLEMGRAD